MLGIWFTFCDISLVHGYNNLAQIKMSNKNIGRFVLFKYCIISLGVIISIVLIIELYNLVFIDHVSGSTFLKNQLNYLYSNMGFFGVQVIVMSGGIWVIGGIAGQTIITQKFRHKMLVGGLTLFLMWVLLFISSALDVAIEYSINWGWEGFGPAISGWLINGLFNYLFFGAIHGLFMGYYVERDIKLKGRAAQEESWSDSLSSRTGLYRH